MNTQAGMTDRDCDKKKLELRNNLKETTYRHLRCRHDHDDSQSDPEPEGLDLVDWCKDPG